MNNQRLARFDRSPNVDAEAVPLPFRRIFVPVIVQPRLADGDHLRVSCQRHQIGNRRLPNVGRFGMYADRCENPPVRFRQRQYPRELFERNANADGATDIVVLHQLEYLRQIGREVGKVQVAVRINEH